MTPIENGHYRLVAERDIRAEIGAAVLLSGGALLRLNHVEPSLDTVYRHYFEGQSSNGPASKGQNGSAAA